MSVDGKELSARRGDELSEAEKRQGGRPAACRRDPEEVTVACTRILRLKVTRSGRFNQDESIYGILKKNTRRKELRDNMRREI